MCQAFSCIVLKSGEVKWKFGVDSHSDIMEHFGIRDNDPAPDAASLPFAKIEITPDNKNYLTPDKWTLRVDERVKPKWFTTEDVKAAFVAHKKWLRKLNTILVKKTIVNPFVINPPQKITRQHLSLLKQWASVRDSVWASVRASVWDSVWASVGASVRDSVGASVWASVGASVGASVRDSVGASVSAYIGSFFKIPKKSWKYTEKIPGKSYPFQPAVDLWEMGLVPSFDGKIWRLHGGKNAKVLWEGSV